VYTPTHGRKWWLLRNGRTLLCGGILLLVLLPVLCFYFMIVVSFSVFVWAALVILFTMDILWIKHASCYRTLYCMAEELRCTLEDFDPLRLIIKVRKGTGSYFILFHPYVSFYSMWIAMTRLGPVWNVPSRHYQVWTPLKGSYPATRDRYGFMEYVRPSGIGRLFPYILSAQKREIVFDEELMKRVPHLHDTARNISSLRFMGLAVEKKKTILLGLLTRFADSLQVSQTLEVLKKAADEIEHPPSER